MNAEYLWHVQGLFCIKGGCFFLVSGLPPFGWAVSNPCGVVRRHPGARSCSWCSDCTEWSLRNFNFQTLQAVAVVMYSLKNHLKIYKKSQLFWRQFPTKNHLCMPAWRSLYLVASNQPPWGDCKDWESLRFWNPRYGLCACWCGCGRSQSDEFLYRCGPLTCFWVYSSLAKGWDQIRSWNTLHLALTPFTAK